MRKDKKINSAILVIGDEILSGRTQDLNVSYLSKWLNENFDKLQKHNKFLVEMCIIL